MSLYPPPPPPPLLPVPLSAFLPFYSFRFLFIWLNFGFGLTAGPAYLFRDWSSWGTSCSTGGGKYARRIDGESAANTFQRAWSGINEWGWNVGDGGHEGRWMDWGCGWVNRLWNGRDKLKARHSVWGLEVHCAGVLSCKICCDSKGALSGTYALHLDIIHHVAGIILISPSHRSHSSPIPLDLISPPPQLSPHALLATEIWCNN